MRIDPVRCASLCILLVIALARSAPAQASVAAATGRSRLDPGAQNRIDDLIEDAIAAGKCPGAVLLVGRGDDVLYRRAYGNRAVEPATAPAEPETIYDMASLTKAVATAPSIMVLADDGKLNVSDKVSKYIPEFGRNDKQDITVEQLLLHRGGLIPDNDIADYASGPAIAWKNLFALQTKWEPGTHFAYSDVGYEVLGKLVEVVSGKPLDQFARERIFEPLGMIRTAYKPPESWKVLCAPTEQRDGRPMLGEVHDPRAYALGGVAGHAGLFSTADDLSRFCRMLLHGGILDGKRVLKETTVREMTRERCLSDGTGCRGYGFDIDTPYSGCRGDRFQRGTTFGHTGFTGTMFWIDPISESYFILLTNSVHPNGKGNVLALRHQMATVVAEAVLGADGAKIVAATQQSKPVLCGIDVLEAQQFAPLRGKRIALVTNQTGLDAAGERTIDLLLAAKDVHLTKLFSPEHGWYGLLDEKVSDATDPKTKLKVYSLYGGTQKPTADMLKDIDAIVFDIQDVGARFYTYTSTLGLCMESAAAQKIQFIVLDRPNPNTGFIVDGPLADEKNLAFVAYAPIPVSHGMTEGELARMFNVERHINCDLTVINMQGWRRRMWWDDTGRMWVNPSPNMRNPTQSLLYLGIGLIEASNVSVGRGTDQPFELFGAPWIDARKLAASLNAAALPGVRFVPTAFTPNSSKFTGQLCHGCYIQVTDRSTVQPIRTGLTIAWTLDRLFGKSFEFEKLNNLLRSDQTLQSLRSTDDPSLVSATWQQSLDSFAAIREKYLLYR